MKKPWEQEWRSFEGPCGGRIESESGDVLADEVSEAALPIMLAAPDMARALLALLPIDCPNHTRECLDWRVAGGYITECLSGCAGTIAALKKSGVL